MSKAMLRLWMMAGLVVIGASGCVEDRTSGTSAASGTPASDNGSETAANTNTEVSESEGETTPTGNNENEILIDGSSTVGPVSIAMAEGFMKKTDGAKVVVRAFSGTSGGFKSFMKGETDINDASRPIKDKETTTCKENGIDPLELTVAIDGISVVVNKDNTWCDELSFEQLKAIWEPGSKIKTWKDVNADWPDEKLVLYGPDSDSGTFEYFTEKVCETKKQCRKDYNPAVDDNVLVNGVKGSKYALGYFGYGYYLKARRDLKGLSVSRGEDAAVAPNAKSIESYEYPLARPIFIYVNKSRLTDKHMADFLKFYLTEGQSLVAGAGCVKLSDEVVGKSVAALEEALGSK